MYVSWMGLHCCFFSVCKIGWTLQLLIALYSCCFCDLVFSCACLYTVSQKRHPWCFSCNLPCQIFIIFGRNITQKVSNQKMLYFSTCSYATLRNWKHGNCTFHVNVSCWFANRHTIHIDCRLITVRLLFIHETIGCVHQTRPKKATMH